MMKKALTGICLSLVMGCAGPTAHLDELRAATEAATAATNAVTLEVLQ